MDLLDLLWRDHPAAPRADRGPRARLAVDDVVAAAVDLADAEGLPALTVRRLAAGLGIATMSVYTYVGSREDLLVLMVDRVTGPGDRAPLQAGSVRDALTALAQQQLDRWLAHPWLLDVHDQRVALGPGTIARYEVELQVVARLGLADVETDAALGFVTDFTRGAARSRAGAAGQDLAGDWQRWGERLAGYLGDRHPLAQRVGAAVGAELSGTWDAQRAWEFGLGRVLDALLALAPQAG